MKFFLLCKQAVYRVALFIIAGVMCLYPMERPTITEPELKNKDTGSCFLPDYGQPLISAHRTGRGVAPENTMMAIKKCIESDNGNTDMLEMDVEMTKDGVLVLYHSLYLDEKTDAEERFGKKNVTVFSKTYDEIHELNMGEKFKSGEYAGLRGDDIPDDLRIAKLEEVFDYVESVAPGKYTYTVEVKYPYPWAPDMVDGIYKLLVKYDLTERVIVGSFWNDVTNYIDKNYSGKIMRSANPFEIVDFYGRFKRNEEIKEGEIKFMALQMPYYETKGVMYIGNLGRTDFMEYAHKYGISVQYWTVSNVDDAKALTLGGADVLMTDYPDRIASAIR